MDEEVTTPKEPLTFLDIASLATAIAVYLGRDDKTVIDQIGYIAEAIKFEMQKENNDEQPETT
jgi:pyruvoyl-dependent arginine decarboxylase (PvlArgDC)